MIEALETARAHTPASLSTPVDATGELTLIDLIGEDEEGYAALDGAPSCAPGSKGSRSESGGSSSSASCTG